MFLTCAKEAPYLVKVDGQALDPETFICRYRLTKDYANITRFTVDQLKTFIEANFIENLLYQADGYKLKLDQDSATVADLENEKKKILTRTNGQFFRTIIRNLKTK